MRCARLTPSEVAFSAHRHIDERMPREQLEHVVEKANARFQIGSALTVETLLHDRHAIEHDEHRVALVPFVEDDLIRAVLLLVRKARKRVEHVVVEPIEHPDLPEPC